MPRHDRTLGSYALDTTDDDLMQAWLALPETDTRTLAEFSAHFGERLADVPRGVLWWNGSEHVIMHMEIE